MSNLGQYYGKGFPLGTAITGQAVPTKSQTYNAPDGSVWLLNGNALDPIAYDSSYSQLPDFMTVSMKYLKGYAANGLIYNSNTSFFSLAHDPINNILITNSIWGSTTSGFSYYRTIDNGTTWTKLTFPNNVFYRSVSFVGGRFIAMAQATTNGAIYSTDGISWTSVTLPTTVNYGDIIQGNSNNLVARALSGTTPLYSLDNGSTWTAGTGATLQNSTIPGQNIGFITWNAAAGLFIGQGLTVGTYFTSPTGATWTERNSASYYNYQLYITTTSLFASSSTKTIVFGLAGCYLSTTDGVTWSAESFIDKNLIISQPSFAYHDGTRFVVCYSPRIFYSVDGITWTEGKSIFTTVNRSVYTGGKLYIGVNQTGSPQPIFYIDDVTDTTKRYIVPTNNQSGSTTSTTLTRIK